MTESFTSVDAYDGLYPPEVLRRFFALPPGPLPSSRQSLVIRGAAGRPETGTRVAFAALLAGERIEALHYGVYGCPWTVAACSLAAERLQGQPVVSLGRLDPGELSSALGVPRERAGSLLIVQDALHNCLADWDNARSRVSPEGDDGGGNPDR